MMPLTQYTYVVLMRKLFRKMARISIHMSSYGSLSNLIFFSMHNNRIIRENENGNEIAQHSRSLFRKNQTLDNCHQNGYYLGYQLVLQGSSLEAGETEKDNMIFSVPRRKDELFFYLTDSRSTLLMKLEKKCIPFLHPI